MSIVTATKKIAASTVIAASLGLGGLALASGIAAAAPADHAGSGSSGEVHAHVIPGFVPKPATGGDDVVHAHVIPGFVPKPATGSEGPVIPAHLIPGFVPKPTTGTEDPIIPAHLIPGFTPAPIQTTTSRPALGGPWDAPGYDPSSCTASRAACQELIHE